MNEKGRGSRALQSSRCEQCRTWIAPPLAEEVPQVPGLIADGPPHLMEGGADAFPPPLFESLGGDAKEARGLLCADGSFVVVHGYLMGSPVSSEGESP